MNFLPTDETSVSSTPADKLTGSTLKDYSTGSAYYYHPSTLELIEVPATVPLCILGRGLTTIGEVNQYLVDPESPTDQTTEALSIGVYTLWTGGPAYSVTSGTATITGSGTATKNSPIVFYVTEIGRAHV